MKLTSKYICVLLIAFLIAACDNSRYTNKEIETNQPEGDTTATSSGDNPSASELYPRTNSEGDPTAYVVLNTANAEMSAAATFTTMEDNKVNFRLDVENFPPGDLAVHIHENGDCGAADYSSAGGHWNPSGENHGKRGVPPFHNGDIANITVGDDGRGTLNMVVEGWSIGGDEQESNILNRAIIVHSGPDDFTSQPSGNAGSRIACGVIQLYKK